ncbi:ribokinase [Saccharopolyspora antimicrobica]|uniref:Ribokinase n=1 Tax=Saccharopolyspora antimicrobica TaxID=455193 RepID=A0A1I5F100_9PSEU|nr:ribokinase [Saccharopolyspora antimicrobica]RKT83633.1 ribokinase [Saccharopolyspora antimicrobica]SFO17468.1 ribokinase [Saccharopolyspora antimicrobica]
MRIAVVGSYGTGMTMRAERIPGRGETLGDATFSLGPGGKGSNQAIGAARLGADVSFLTAVGDDVLGAQGRELWQREGVDASAVATVDAPTMTGVILVEQDGENRIIVAPGALDLLSPAHVAGFAEVIADADLLMVCNEIPADTVAAALRTAAEHGTPTLFNPAPARDLPQDVAALVDVLTPNLTEAQVLTGLDTTDPGVLLDALRQRFAAKIVLTCGTDGAHVDDGVERAHIPPVLATRVVDTTGAGDAFNAAFAVAWCRGWDLRRAARYAAAAGAFAVAHHEVVPGLPRSEDLEER